MALTAGAPPPTASFTSCLSSSWRAWANFSLLSPRSATSRRTSHVAWMLNPAAIAMTATRAIPPTQRRPIYCRLCPGQRSAVARSVTCTPMVGGSGWGVVRCGRYFPERSPTEISPTLKFVTFASPMRAPTPLATDMLPNCASRAFNSRMSAYCRSGFPQFNDQCLGQSTQILLLVGGSKSTISATANSFPFEVGAASSVSTSVAAEGESFSFSAL